jgi:hypothetical protein
VEENSTVSQGRQLLSEQNTVPQEKRNTSRIPIEEELRFFFSSTHVQIQTPHQLDAALLQPFLHPFHMLRQELFLMTYQKKEITPATLEAVHENYLVVNTNRAVWFYPQRDKVLLVVFPTPQRYYVLQTQIDALYLDQLNLRYMDPQADIRRHIHLTTPVFLRVIPPDLFTAIEQRQVRIIREVTLPQEDDQETIQEGLIADRFSQSDANACSPYRSLFEEAPPLTCRLHDISRAGICLFLEGSVESEEILQRLVLLYISLPPIPMDATHAGKISFTLRLLGVIKAVRTAVRPWTLHIQFLKRLPQEFEPLLAYLEQQT